MRLGRLEAQYEELFSEVIEDGVITAEERARLERAADALGLDRERLLQLEQALTAAYEGRRRVARARDRGRRAAAEPAGAADAPRWPRGRGAELRAQALDAARARARGAHRRARGRARGGARTSGGRGRPLRRGAASAPAARDRRSRGAPPPAAARSARRRACSARCTGPSERAATAIAQWCAAHALVYLGRRRRRSSARSYASLRTEGLVRPRASLSRESWQRLLVAPRPGAASSARSSRPCSARCCSAASRRCAATALSRASIRPRARTRPPRR